MSNGHYNPCGHSKSAYAQSVQPCDSCGIRYLKTELFRINQEDICKSCKNELAEAVAAISAAA
jgi:hypothetical protein